MKKRFYITLSGIIIASLMGSLSSKADTPTPLKQQAVHTIPSGAEYLQNKVIVKLKEQYRSNVSVVGIVHPAFAAVSTNIGLLKQEKKFKLATAPVQKINAQGQKLADLSLIYELEISKISVAKALSILTATGMFEYVEPHYIFKSTYVPNDPDTSAAKSYYLKSIKALEAWDINKGSSTVIIGITDSGIDIDHPDLVGNIYINTADPINGIDDDMDGYIDNNKGWDLGGADFNTVVEDNDPNIKGSNNSHGSHVSGCASASTDNGIGVSGVGFNSKILPIKCAADNDTRSSGGQGFIIAGYEGIAYAADHGAHIINCSWGGAGGGSFGQDVIDYATINKGCLVVAAAGNDGAEIEHFPSGYNYVLSVAASSSSDRKSNFSNFGYSIDVMAPGSAIYSTLYNDSYNYLSGTSMASPIVAGAAAIIKAQYPTYTGLQIGEVLRATADNVDAINQSSVRGKIGTGRINLLRALTESGTPAIRLGELAITDKNNGSYLPGDTLGIVIDFTNYLASTQNLTVAVTTTNPRAKIVQGTANLGVINTLETKNNASTPFRVALLSTVQESELITLKLTLTDASKGYSGVEYVTIAANLTTINVITNRISSTVTSNARVGFSNGDATGGLGFTIDGKQLIYELSLMGGNSANRIINNARAATATPDDEFATLSRVKAYESAQSDFHAKALINDSKDANPYGLEIIQKTYAWSQIGEDQYFIQVLKLVNNSSSEINDFYIGYFGDYDIGDATKNSSGYDQSRRLGYVYDTDSNGSFGAIKALHETLGGTFHSSSNNSTQGTVNMGDGLSDAEKFSLLSTDNGPVITAKEDVMINVGSGPFTIASGDTLRLGFAFIGGTSLVDIQTAADKAQIKYNGLVDDADIDSIPTNITTTNLKSLSVFPNPSAQYITLTGGLGTKDFIKAAIYGLDGKLVELIDLGAYQTHLNATLSIAHLPTGIYTLQLTGSTTNFTTKLIKK